MGRENLRSTLQHQDKVAILQLERSVLKYVCGGHFGHLHLKQLPLFLQSHYVAATSTLFAVTRHHSPLFNQAPSTPSQSPSTMPLTKSQAQFKGQRSFSNAEPQNPTELESSKPCHSFRKPLLPKIKEETKEEVEETQTSSAKAIDDIEITTKTHRR